MTSVTLTTTSEPMNGSFSTSLDESVTSRPAFETPKPVKRCLAAPLDSYKKRRKQATPVRISATEPQDVVHSPEGKPLDSPVPEPEIKCSECHFLFDSSDQLHSHIANEHPNFHCKREPEENLNYEPQTQNAFDISSTRNDISWIGDIQSKDFLNLNFHGLVFSPASSLFMSLPSFPQTDNPSSRQSVRIFNPDAFCDLCNKEFCNKYFLKTHKANKHGIYADPPSSEALAISPFISSMMKIPTTSFNCDIPSLKTELKQQPQKPQFCDMLSAIHTSKAFSKSSKQTVTNFTETENKEVIDNPEQSTSETEQFTAAIKNSDDNEGSCSPGVITASMFQYKSDSNLDQDGLNYSTSNKSSPAPSSKDMDASMKYKKAGIMNPKAFCEICCKEYCNKYFLRTHKMKRHGIYVPDEGRDSKDNKSEPFQWNQNIQTSPLNLIMNEQQSNSNSASERDRKTSTPQDYRCDICGINFQNSSLSHLHNVSVHSSEKETSTSDIINREHHLRGGKSLDLQTTSTERGSCSTEPINEDLQKLQTMILQLNELDVGKTNLLCNICSKEYDSKYTLQAHMMSTHGLLLEDVAPGDKCGSGLGPGTSSRDVGSSTSTSNSTICDLCGKDFFDVEGVKKHVLECHPINFKESKENNYMNTEKTANKIMVPGTPTSSERRSAPVLTPSSSYCEICNKELCNKYFMKTHMQRMHGIEIENGAQIGGVVCDICNKELCSKYFLRVHKHNTHGIAEYNSGFLQSRKGDAESIPMLPTESDPALKPIDLADLSHRYFSHFTEVCSICSRRFRSTKWLKAHLLSDHGQAGAEKWVELEQNITPSNVNVNVNFNSKAVPQVERTSPLIKIPNGNQETNSKIKTQNVFSSIFGADENSIKTYDCSYCPFSTPVLPLLLVHERSHDMRNTSPENENTNVVKCPVCAKSFPQTGTLQHHIVSEHPFFHLSPQEESENHQNGVPKDGCDNFQEEWKIDDSFNAMTNNKDDKSKNRLKRKLINSEVSFETTQTLKEVVKKFQLPATYALPLTSSDDDEAVFPGYIMQAFTLNELASERSFVPSVVFLPVLQKLSNPLNVTFNLSPA
ncbi:uncharacterized protein LOC108733816 [Agrilus planipennis]|uniref:Uncharacterized protein LOC108733816 n=1 Tax=Agrilus planipennis TaxID=224129 RepID=A0A1W4WJK4_AGRPL|nr:uncharacterized protein LOC108733816 [Agrilus planipennis]